MDESILNSIKKLLGIAEEYTVFDLDILLHINSTFSTLSQLGIGPSEGFHIEDKNPTWVDFLGTNPHYNSVKSYVYIKVRLLFDPPTTSYHLTSLKEQAQEYEYRLNLQHDDDTWVQPTLPIVDSGLVW